MKALGLSRTGLIVVCLGIFGTIGLRAQVHTQQVGGVTMAIEAGVGGMFGDVTYRIGGLTEYQSGSSHTYHYPISELKFPLNNAMARVRFAADINRIGVEAWFAKNITEAAGTMEDSDWSDESNPSVKTVFSESDSELDAWIGSASLNLYFVKSLGPLRHTLAGTLGILYEHCYWENSNFDQWYPSNPSASHDYYAGVGITYEANLLMPYIGLKEQVSSDRGELTASVNFAPWAQVEDEDDHVYRNIRSNMTADGMAVQFALQGSLNLGPKIYLFARGEALLYWADGTSENIVYGSGVNNSSSGYEGQQWTIEEDITGTQLTALAGVGFKL